MTRFDTQPLTARRTPTAARPAAPIDAPRRSTGFTLVEILAVVVIISILLAIGLAVGPQVIGRGEANNTKITMQNLLSILEVYKERTGIVPDNTGDNVNWNIYKDAYLGDGDGEGQELNINTQQHMKDRSIFQFAAVTFAIPEIRDAFYNNRELEFQNAGGHVLITDGWGRAMIYCDGNRDTLDRLNGPARFLPEYTEGAFFASAGPDGEWGDHRELEKRLNGQNHSEELADQAADNIYSFDLGR